MDSAREHIQSELETVFRRVFDDDELVISEATRATNVGGWGFDGPREPDHCD